MRYITFRFLLLAILLLSIVGCGGGGGGGGGGGDVGITASINTTVTVPTAVSTISISGVTSPLVCGVNLQVTYPSGTTYANDNPTNGIPAGTIISLVNSNAASSDITVFGATGFGSGDIAKINYGTVPIGSSSTSFGVTILKIFDCNGVPIQ